MRSLQNYARIKVQQITIIKSSSGNIFGAYSGLEWKGEDQYSFAAGLKDESSFLFLLKSSEEEEQKKCPRLFHLRDDIHHSFSAHYARITGDRGPVFGNGYDICIGSNCNEDLS